MVVIWNGKDNLLMPDMSTLTPNQFKEHYEMAKAFPVLLEINTGVVFSYTAKPVVSEVFNIDPDLSDDEFVAEYDLALKRGRDPQYDEIEDMIETMERAVQGDDE